MSTTNASLPEGYTLKTGAPDPQSYNELRRRAGLTPTTDEQAIACIAGAWCAYHIVHDTSSTAVAMGRVIGDGGWYFHVIDMATLPEHQRKGLGKVILSALIDKIRKDAPPGAYINLLADAPGRPLYRKLGFQETGEREIGMAMRLKIENVKE